MNTTTVQRSQYKDYKVVSNKRYAEKIAGLVIARDLQEKAKFHSVYSVRQGTVKIS